MRRVYRNGRVKWPKTEASIRAPPLQTISLAALERVPANGQSPLVFPSPMGEEVETPVVASHDVAAVLRVLVLAHVDQREAELFADRV